MNEFYLPEHLPDLVKAGRLTFVSINTCGLYDVYAVVNFRGSAAGLNLFLQFGPVTVHVFLCGSCQFASGWLSK